MNQQSGSIVRPSPATGDEGKGTNGAPPPQLLGQLPGSFFLSPGFITGVAVMEFLYALLLFAVMSTHKREDTSPTFDPEGRSAAYASRALPPELKTPANATGKTEPAPPGKTETPDTKKAAPKEASKQEVKPPTAPPPSQNPTPAPADTPKKAAEPAPSPKSPAPTTVASISKPETPALPKPAAAVETPAVTGKPTIGPLGSLDDPLNDCEVTRDGKTLTIQIPGKLHIFDPVTKTQNAPRALTDVTGDFVAQVRIAGNVKPGTKPINELPFTFQGAGLLLWRDAANYVRFERAAMYTVQGGTIPLVLVENCTDGKPGRNVPIKVKEGPITLRLERRSGELNCTYSADGKTWLGVKKFVIPLPKTVHLGISASNVSPRAFAARFEDFTLKASGASGN